MPLESKDAASAPLHVLCGKSFVSFCLSFVPFVSFCSICLSPTAFARAAEIDFERQVGPILTQNCVKCHNRTKSRAGLNLSTREAALKGSDAGEVLVPGKPDQSLLIKRATDGSMPPETDGRRLAAEEVAVLAAWVEAGAKWPTGLTLAAAEAPAAEKKVVAPPPQRGGRRLRIRRIHLHARWNLSAAK